MTFADRVDRLARLGYTDRQASFLVTVMLHAGVCLERQYCTAARLVHGQKTRNFFRNLVSRHHATAYPCARRGARVYHVHAKPLYEQIGEPHNRHRKPVALSRAVERLMVLDAVFSEPHVTWFATESEKLAHFTVTTSLGRDQMPQLVFQSAGARTIRYFPDKLPIGLCPDGRTHVFLYSVHKPSPADFRVFLFRHAPLLRALPRWTVRLLVPAHLEEAASTFQRACEEELATRLAPSTVEELRWYFHQRREASHAGGSHDEERYRRARRTFGAPRYRVLYRQWLLVGDSLIDALLSPILSDAIQRGTARIETHVLTRRYHHLSPLVGTS